MASLFGEDDLFGTRKKRATGLTDAGAPTGTSTMAIPRVGGTAVDPFVPGTDGPGPYGGPSGGINPDANNGIQPTAPTPTSAASPTAPRVYGDIPGLVTGKLQNEGYQTYKYGDAARAFSSFLGGGGHVARNSLDDLVKYAQEQFGLKNAKVVGDDKWDPDGDGGELPIDVILGNGGLWWGQEDSVYGPQSAPAASAEPFDFSRFLSQPSAPAAAPDMSWLADLLKVFQPQPAAPAAPAAAPAPSMVMNVPGLQPSYSQPSPTFRGDYVAPGFEGNPSAPMDATSLLSMALPRLLQDPNAMNDPLIRQILGLTAGGR